MKINCVHGFFTFEETRAGELSDFVSLFGLELARRGSLFTFAALAEAPVYSIKGAPLLDATAIETFEGDPGEVFRKNAVVYNYDLGQVVPIASITSTVQVKQALNYFVTGGTGLILPGSLTDGGKRVTDYAAHFSIDQMKFKFSEVVRV